MQNMLFFLSLLTAKLEPIVSVAGRAGGTIIVIRSRARILMVFHDNFRCQYFIFLRTITFILQNASV